MPCKVGHLAPGGGANIRVTKPDVLKEQMGDVDIWCPKHVLMTAIDGLFVRVGDEFALQMGYDQTYRAGGYVVHTAWSLITREDYDRRAESMRGKAFKGKGKGGPPPPTAVKGPSVRL
eukprot:gene7390-7370_t